MERLTLDIEGMHCSHCVSSVTKALGALDGVQVETVGIGSAQIAYDPARVDVDTILMAVGDEGYAASRGDAG
jgi:copper chaperone